MIFFSFFPFLSGGNKNPVKVGPVMMLCWYGWMKMASNCHQLWLKTHSIRAANFWVKKTKAGKRLKINKPHQRTIKHWMKKRRVDLTLSSHRTVGYGFEKKKHFPFHVLAEQTDSLMTLQMPNVWLSPLQLSQSHIIKYLLLKGFRVRLYW